MFRAMYSWRHRNTALATRSADRQPQKAAIASAVAVFLSSSGYYAIPSIIMHLSSLLVALSCCGAAMAAPLEQQQAPLVGSAGHHAGPHKVTNPYRPGVADPYDRKVDSQGDKLQPLPYVSRPTCSTTSRQHH